MKPGNLKIHAECGLGDARMVLAFSGWMDGGDVSTGTVDWLIRALGARNVARIDPEGFYIYSFPGSMELSAMFRPHTRILEGLVEDYRPPDNEFFCDERNRLLLFRGKEPNLAWEEFAECVFSFALTAGVSSMFFVGSFAGMVPHTRDPRLTSAVSNESIKPALEQYGVRFATYEGPASFSTYLTRLASARGIRMASLVAEIPAYIQGTNPKCIEAVIRKLSAILELQLDLDELRATSSAWEQKISEALQEKSDLTELVVKLEEAYDSEVFDTELGDLKQWLEQQGIRVD